MGASVRVPIDLRNGEKLLLVVMADGALLYRRSKIKVAMTQTEMVATVLNEGVQSARAQIPFFTWAKGDTLQEHLENAGYELLQRYTTNEFIVKMPQEYPGARTHIAEVTALVGDSKWIWSVFGVVQNWTRPVASGPFTTTQVITHYEFIEFVGYITYETHKHLVCMHDFRLTNLGSIFQLCMTDSSTDRQRHIQTIC